MSLKLLGYLSQSTTTNGELFNVQSPSLSSFGELSIVTNEPIVQTGFPYNYISTIEFIQNTTGGAFINCVGKMIKSPAKGQKYEMVR